MDVFRDIDSGARSLARQGGEVAGKLERGQAETPLADHFAAISEDLQSAPFCVVVVGVDQASRTAVLGWLLGQDPRALTVRDKDAAGLIEITLQSAGYALETAGGGRQEYETLDSFLEAIKQADLAPAGDDSSWVDLLRLSMPAPAAELQGLKLLMPRNTEAFARNPALIARLLQTANVALVCAPADFQPDDDTIRVLGELMPGMAAMLPVVPGPAPVDPQRGWWRLPVFSQCRVRLPPAAIGDGLALPPVALLADPADPLRQGLARLFHVRRFDAAIAAVGATQQHELAQMKTRRAKEERRSKSFERHSHDHDVQGETEAVKRLIEDEFGALTQGMEQSDKKALLPGGPIMHEVDTLIARLTFEDLEQEKGIKNIRLSIPQGFEERLTATAKSASRKQIASDLSYIRDGLAALKPQLEEQLATIVGRPVNLDLGMPEDADMREQMSGLFKAGTDYKGDIPIRKFMQRLGEGRRAAFVVLMTLSIAGVVLGKGNLRSAGYVGVLILIVFFASVMRTYRSWSREDAEKAEGEIKRAREIMTRDIQKVLNDAQREKSAFLRRHFDQLRKEAMRVLETGSRDARERTVREGTEVRKQVQDNLRNLDKRMRDLQSLDASITRLKQSGRDLVAKCQDAVRNAAAERPE